MKKNNGQALIEFVIILPVFLLIICALVDFGNIIYKKYNLEADLDLIVDLYQRNKIEDINNYSAEKGMNIQYVVKDDMLTIIISQDVLIITPVINKILNSPYKIEVDRVIYHE